MNKLNSASKKNKIFSKDAWPLLLWLCIMLYGIIYSSFHIILYHNNLLTTDLVKPVSILLLYLIPFVGVIIRHKSAIYLCLINQVSTTLLAIYNVYTFNWDQNSELIAENIGGILGVCMLLLLIRWFWNHRHIFD